MLTDQMFDLETRQDFADDLIRTKGFSIPDPAPPLPSPNMITARSGKIREVIWTVATNAGLTCSDLLRHRKTRALVECRAIVVLIAYDRLGMSSSEIGDAMSRDHTTILHAVKRGRELLQDPGWRAEYEQALRMLG